MKRGGVNERLRAACLQKMPQGAQPPAYNRCLEGHNRLPAIGASRGTTARLQKVPQGAQLPKHRTRTGIAQAIYLGALSPTHTHICTHEKC